MWMLAIAAAGAAAPELVTVPAAGRHEVVLTVPAFGRYAVSVASAQGAAVQVVDALTGPGAFAGEPGVRDGRVDLFLDRGRVKVVVLGDPRASGQATVAVRPFTDPSPLPHLLPTGRPVSTQLGETEERSYWLEVAEDRTVWVDAAGRRLTDLRLWRDGNWLIDAEPSCVTLEPSPGQPLRRCLLSTELPSGLYRVTAYGGEGQPWANASAANPLVVTEGARPLGLAGQIAGTIGPTGVETWQLHEDTQTVYLALPDVASAALSVGPSPTEVSSRAEITTKSRRPTATIATEGGGFVTVTGKPGQRFQLVWFGDVDPDLPPGDWYVTTVHAADPRDVLDPCAVVYELADGKPTNGTATQAIVLDRKHRFERAFNLTGITTTVLDVRDRGTYRIRAEGAKAAVKLRPYLVTKPVAFADVGGAIDLDPGLYELRLTPGAGEGVVTLSVLPDGGSASLPAASLRSAVSFASLRSGSAQRVAVSAPPGVAYGLVKRQLPLDPTDPVPVSLLPGETLELPIRVADVGVLQARTADGQLAEVSVDGGPWGPAPRIEPGDHRLAVRGGSLTVGFTPDRLAPELPLPPMDARLLDAMPQFAVVGPGRPVGFDLEPGYGATMTLALPDPGLYRIESTGLLSTRGFLRSRVATRIATADSNGVGRNFLIGTYLRAGDYQVTVLPNEPSSGHAGLRVVRTRVDEGGEIVLGTEARATVPADVAVRYAVQVGEAGRYRIRHAIAAQAASCRLEDGDGWPVVAPDGPCDLVLDLTPGRYTVLGAPMDLETRRQTTFTRERDPVLRTGHGPFALDIGEEGRAVWAEPTGDAERAADVWTVKLEAPVNARVDLSPEMAADLLVDGQLIGRSLPGNGFAGPLPAGALRIEVRGARRGTGVPYALTLTTSELVAGSKRAIDGDARVPVSVGVPGIYTFASRGSADVRARLEDVHGRLVASNDDRPDDWNFRITTRLDPGQYTLVVRTAPPPTPVAPPDAGGDTGWDTGGDTGYAEEVVEPVAYDPPEATIVEMRAPMTLEGTVLADLPVEVRPGAEAVVLPYSGGRGADVVVAWAESAENVGVAIEARDGAVWTPLASGSGRAPVAAVRADGRVLRVRVWSEDQRGLPATVRAQGLRTRLATAAELARGVGDAGFTAVRADGGAGQFRLGRGLGQVLVCGGPGEGCAPTRRSVVSGGGDGLVLVTAGGPVRAERIVLSPGRAVDLELGEGQSAVDLAGTGPVALVARASAGQPAMALKNGWLATADGASIAVTLDGAREAVVWEGGSAARLDVALTRLPLEGRTQVAGAMGRTTVVIPARGAVTVALDRPTQAAIGLEAGLVAVVPGLGAVWAEPGATTVRVQRAEERIVLVNPTDREAGAVLDLLGAPEGEAIALKQPFERLATDDAEWLVRVAPGDGVLRVRGAAGQYVGADGRVLPAEGAAIGSGGAVRLRTRPGPVLAWVEAGAGGPLAEVDAGKAVRVESGVVPLEGAARRIAVEGPGGRVASLAVPCPAVAVVSVDGRPDRVEVLGAGERLDLVTGGASAEVVLRALRGAALYGEAVVTTSALVEAGEGVGPEQLVAAGGAVFYRFDVARAGPVGVGVRSAAGRVDAVLYDAAGARIASGAAVMPELAAGAYVLALSQPAGAPPVRVQPALVGLSPPPTTPPADVVRAYVETR